MVSPIISLRILTSLFSLPPISRLCAHTLASRGCSRAASIGLRAALRGYSSEQPSLSWRRGFNVCPRPILMKVTTLPARSFRLARWCGELLDSALRSIVLAVGFGRGNCVVVSCRRFKIVQAHAENCIRVVRV
jgi:hypothetical protein